MPNNEPSSGQRGKASSRFQKWLREKYPRVYGFFFSETPFYIHHFFGLLVSLGILGGFLAITVPLWKSWNSVPFLGLLIPAASTDYSEPKAIADLRLHILYITGGIIAILTLLQTNWKNQVDRRKIEDDIQKNKNDHIRQVHAERRSRYTKAVEQLADERATIRLGGIYTLIGLVDEWLDDSYTTRENRVKEGQLIINNLCTYLCAPFALAKKRHILEDQINLDKYVGDFEKDRRSLHEEQNIRRKIFEEFSDRIFSINKAEKRYPSIWLDLNFDLSNATFFYSLSDISFNNITIKNSSFYGDTGFHGSHFFGSTQFTFIDFYGWANFTNSHFYGTTKFNSSNFHESSMFVNSTFHQRLEIENVYFHGKSLFSIAKFMGRSSFRDAKFIKGALFYKAQFHNIASFFEGSIAKDDVHGEPIFQETLFNYQNSPSFYNDENPDAYEFKMGLAEINLPDGTTIKKYIPEGSLLFSPHSWDDEKQKYTCISNVSKSPYTPNEDTEILIE